MDHQEPGGAVQARPWLESTRFPKFNLIEEKPAFKSQRPTPVNTATKIEPAIRIASVAPVTDNSAWSDDEDTNTIGALHKDPACFNADGTMKSWAEMCDSDEEEEDW